MNKDKKYIKKVLPIYHELLLMARAHEKAIKPLYNEIDKIQEKTYGEGLAPDDISYGIESCDIEGLIEHLEARLDKNIPKTQEWRNVLLDWYMKNERE